ncbi:MAG: hypothetical protein Q8M83_00905 [bacterium]|nr:hypothetical protein [bacterium]
MAGGVFYGAGIGQHIVNSDSLAVFVPMRGPHLMGTWTASIFLLSVIFPFLAVGQRVAGVVMLICSGGRRRMTVGETRISVNLE